MIFGVSAPYAQDPPVAQLVEQLPFKERVGGSIPSGRTNKKLIQHSAGLIFYAKSQLQKNSLERKLGVHSPRALFGNYPRKRTGYFSKFFQSKIFL